jgi:hypothetical protein
MRLSGRSCIGDFVMSLVSLSCTRRRQLGAPVHLLVRMVANIATDGIVGSAPLAGDISTSCGAPTGAT